MTMLASLTTTTFDPAGHVLLSVLPASAFDTRTRRTNRVATLDGGASFNDFGFTDADRTINLVWRHEGRSADDAIDRLTRLYSRVQISLDGQMHLAAIESYTPGADESALRLLVVRRLDA
jgi:hypothetical protein